MALTVSSFITTDEGEMVIPLEARGSDDFRIYASVLVGQPGLYQNFRLYSPRGFFGYFQLFDGEAVAETVTLSNSSQRVFSVDKCCVAAMEDRCRKYSCLALKLDWIGQLLTLAFPPIAAGIGIYPFSSDAANFGDDLISDTPSSIAWKYEPGVSVLLELVFNTPDLSFCNPPVAFLPAPEGCRGTGQPVPAVGACIPTTPSGGGGT